MDFISVSVLATVLISFIVAVMLIVAVHKNNEELKRLNYVIDHIFKSHTDLINTTNQRINALAEYLDVAIVAKEKDHTTGDYITVKKN